MAEDTTTPKPGRAPIVPRGFDVMIGTPADVAEAVKMGKFSEIETKAELENRFAEWIGVRYPGLLPDFLAHLKRLAQERLDGMGPKGPPASLLEPPRKAPVLRGENALSTMPNPDAGAHGMTPERAQEIGEARRQLGRTPDGGIPIAGTKEGEG